MPQNRFFILFFFIFLTVAQMPNVQKYQRVFKGEGDYCEGTFAEVIVNSQTVFQTEEEIIRAVAEAVARNSANVKDTSSAVATSQATAQKVLEVVAEAVASIQAEINSPAPCCWALAFGQAEAVAIANATVRAIAQGIAQAFGEEISSSMAMTQSTADSVDNDVQKSIKRIAVLLTDGSGGGRQHRTETIKSVARAKAINCALANAFAQVLGDEASGEVMTQAGCNTGTKMRFIDVGRQTNEKMDGCACIDTPQQGASALCGEWGNKGNDDMICYVKDPKSCPCAYQSQKWGTMAWRYCGPTLGVMQEMMNFKDDMNDIEWVPSGNGFCNVKQMPSDLDKMASEAEGPPQTNTDSPNFLQPQEPVDVGPQGLTEPVNVEPQSQIEPDNVEPEVSIRPDIGNSQTVAEPQNDMPQAPPTNSYQTISDPYAGITTNTYSGPSQDFYVESEMAPDDIQNFYGQYRDNLKEAILSKILNGNHATQSFTCPVIPCVGRVAHCCSQDGSNLGTCETTFGAYEYQGKCNQQLLVWKSNYGRSCYC